MAASTLCIQLRSRRSPDWITQIPSVRQCAGVGIVPEATPLPASGTAGGLVVADGARLGLTPWNVALGNKILHLLFVVALCERHGRRPVVPCDSSLDDVFDLSDLKGSPSHIHRAVPYAYVERSVFRTPGPIETWLSRLGVGPRRQAVAQVVQFSRRQFEDELEFLLRGASVPAFAVRGHFWHYPLMPSQIAVSRWLRLRPDVVQSVTQKYPDLDGSMSVAVHLRDTDYSTHLTNVFPKGVMLDDEYYLRARRSVERRLGAGVRYHLFSDNLPRLLSLFRGCDVVVHEGSPAEDWVALSLARKVIQSNSSFCWTASLYGKDLSLQPAGGLNYFRNDGDVPFGFIMPFSSVISRTDTQRGGDTAVSSPPA